MALNIRSTTWLQYLIFLLFVLQYKFHNVVAIVSNNAGDNNCLEESSRMIDGINGTLVSPGGEFELGFFTPDHDNSKTKKRYLGIWYYNQSNPKMVVWVANRNEPLLEPNGYLVINDSFAKVLDTNGTTYWLTNSVSHDIVGGHPLRTAPSDFRHKNDTIPYNFTRISYPRGGKVPDEKIVTKLCLGDDGNLVLHRREKGDLFLWQSFDDPTDTFLPGMNAIQSNLSLTAWQAPNSPAQGSYVFTLQQLDSECKLSIKKGVSAHYWESGLAPFDQTPSALLSLLRNDVSQLNDNNDTRLVMSFTGQIQFWKREGMRGRDWSLIWSEPKDKCNLFEACGSLGSCNSNNGLLCKCLPGSTANEPERWNSGNFSRGCSLRSEPCHRNYSKDVFLRIPMMRMKAPRTNDTGEEDCETTCREDCTCLAYSCGSTDCTRIDMPKEKMCLIWSISELIDQQEEYSGGLTIFVRTENPTSDITTRDCEACGIFIIPYPLSTAKNCGDPSYFNFNCNATSGQIYFSTSSLTYKVTSLDPDARKFTIQLGHGNSCNSIYNHSFTLSPEDSLHYDIGKCKVTNAQFSFETEKSFIEVEVGWKPPLEPVCNAASDCYSWRHTTCKTAGFGRMRCKCDSTFRWDKESLKCIKVISPLKVGILCIASGILAIILLCGTFFMYRSKNRRNDVTGAVEFMEDDAEGIDVPFFDWETILAATNNFADINKLGTGGFGSVYKGKLPDGHEIAVKRLSLVSVQGLEEFGTEVKLIAKLQHRNLVRLVGYCMKANEKILVYEYMPNGSLDSCLFDEKHCVYLDWEKRFDIMLGIARGLLYLHQDSRLRIIHRDLKPNNILLDEELCPKISVFGLARIIGGKETHASTNRVVGTYGYMSPEYASDGIFSIKSDVYSFGVVVLETIIRRRNSKLFMFEHGLSLLGHAWRLWNEDKGLELMDPTLNETCFPSEVLKCIHVGLLCVQEDPSDRPTMSNVVHMLSGENASLPLANQPAFMNRKPLTENASSSSAMDSSVHDMMTVSTVGR